MASKVLQKWFPGTASPFICNGPMLPYATVRFTSAVLKAGGFGIISGGYEFSAASPQIKSLSAQLSQARELLSIPQNAPLPLGVGFIMMQPAGFISSVLPVLKEHKPAAIWLFAPPNRECHAEIIPALKSAGEEWGLKAFVQVGTVQAAQEAVEDGADVLVLQGVDAGGHQFAHGTSFVTLVPEVVDMLAEKYPNRAVQILAAGGIMDGRGVAAALALGANGAVIGTRLLATEECQMPDWQKQLYISTADGGQSTVKSSAMDHIRGLPWPEPYDGRAIVTDSYKDHVSGLSLEENYDKYKKAMEAGDNSRNITWGGAGVGLIKSVLTIEEVVKGSREQAIKILRSGANL